MRLIGPLQDPVTWYGINYTGTQMTQWEFQNKGKSSWTGTSSFVSKVPLRHLRPSVIYSVPCDRILQRAYWRQKKWCLKWRETRSSQEICFKLTKYTFKETRYTFKASIGLRFRKQRLPLRRLSFNTLVFVSRVCVPAMFNTRGTNTRGVKRYAP